MKTFKQTKIVSSFYFLLTILIISCGGGGGGDRDTPAPVVNTPPTAPTLVGPSDKALCISNAVTLSWNASTDPQNDAVTYQVQVATDNQFSQVVSTGTPSSPSYNVTLDKGKAYYWRVKAIDNKNASSDYSSTFSFYTEGTAVTNHLPFMPQLVAPLQNASINSTTSNLEWNASDVDTSDVLTYDVYWGVDKANMSNSKKDLTTKTTQITSLSTNTTYYWKVVVKDGKGGETVGQIWSFKIS